MISLLMFVLSILPPQEILDQETPVTIEQVQDVTFQDLDTDQKLQYVNDLENYARGLRIAITSKEADYQRAVENQMPEQITAAIMAAHDAKINNLASEAPTMRSVVARSWESLRLSNEE